MTQQNPYCPISLPISVMDKLRFTEKKLTVQAIYENKTEIKNVWGVLLFSSALFMDKIVLIAGEQIQKNGKM